MTQQVKNFTVKAKADNETEERVYMITAFNAIRATRHIELELRNEFIDEKKYKVTSVNGVLKSRFDNCYYNPERIH